MTEQHEYGAVLDRSREAVARLSEFLPLQERQRDLADHAVATHGRILKSLLLTGQPPAVVDDPRQGDTGEQDVVLLDAILPLMHRIRSASR